MSTSQDNPRGDFPSRRWLNSALTVFTISGGDETTENRTPLMLLLCELYDKGWSTTWAGIEAANRHENGTL